MAALALTLFFLAAATAWFIKRPDRALHAASGMASRVLCSGIFVSGQDAAKVYDEFLRVQFAYILLHPLLRYEVDLDKREVTTRIAGRFESRAVHRDGWGCLLLRGQPVPARPFPPDVTAARQTALASLPDIADGPDVVEATDEAVRAAMARPFVQLQGEPRRLAKAVAVLHDGRLIAERYAPGHGVDTPLHGWSASKAVINALVGAMVLQGRLSLRETGVLAAWRDPSDPRHAITVEHLLRQTSGIGIVQTNGGLDAASRMKFIEADMAAFAERAPLLQAPGERWDYTDANYVLLGRILRERAGGSAEDLVRFAHDALFGPLGIRNMTIEVDAAGTPIGSAFMYAPARDWARFGQLFLDDGVVAGRRLLPEGWVTFSATPTLATGYGAGFFTNRVKGGWWWCAWDRPTSATPA